VNILVLGSGGREHAFVATLAKSPAVHKIYACPGNLGMDNIKICKRVVLRDNLGLVSYFKDKVNLAVVGSSRFVKDGTVDALLLAGIPVIGPAADAGLIENSKAFTINFIKKHNIPAPTTKIVANLEEVNEALQENPKLLVIKCDGFSRGTGVKVCKNIEEAKTVAGHFLNKKGPPIIMQERLKGVECSYSILTDGQEWISFSSCRDYKLALDDDLGSTTGGMGAVSPAPNLTRELERQIVETIVQPVVSGMKADNLMYRGFLSIQLMLTDEGPMVLEFNARLGDPEAQTILSRFRGDLAMLLKDCSMGCLSNFGAEVAFGKHSTVSVVLARAGYPESEAKEPSLEGLGEIKDSMVFYASCGRSEDKSKFSYKSGRLVCVTSIGNDREEARLKCYNAISSLRLDGVQYRRDIGL
jgi:phosphoribosylamine--glycine ligase